MMTVIAISVLVVVIPISAAATTDAAVWTCRHHRHIVAPVGVVVVDDGSVSTAAPAVGRDGTDGHGNNKDSQWYQVCGGDGGGKGGGGV